MRSILIGVCLLVAGSWTQAAPIVTFNVRHFGAFDVQLSDETPLHRDNFLRYVEDGLLDGQIIHRSDADYPNFQYAVLQGGSYTESSDPDYLLTQIPTYAPVPLEAHLGGSNVQWSFGAARKSEPDSATSGWFVNMADNSSVFDPNPTYGSPGYTVFGTVVSGFDVLEAVWNLQRWNLGGALGTAPMLDSFDGTGTPTYDDFVIVDSVTTPEPITIGLLGLGAVALTRRRGRA